MGPVGTDSCVVRARTAAATARLAACACISQCWRSDHSRKRHSWTVRPNELTVQTNEQVVLAKHMRERGQLSTNHHATPTDKRKTKATSMAIARTRMTRRTGCRTLGNGVWDGKSDRDSEMSVKIRVLADNLLKLRTREQQLMVRRVSLSSQRACGSKTTHSLWSDPSAGRSGANHQRAPCGCFPNSPNAN
jgi:hypothetical protein